MVIIYSLISLFLLNAHTKTKRKKKIIKSLDVFKPLGYYSTNIDWNNYGIRRKFNVKKKKRFDDSFSIIFCSFFVCINVYLCIYVADRDV